LSAVGWFLGLMLASSAQESRRAAEHFDFNIPAQTLTTALDAYSQASGRELYYDGALTIDRQSSAVRGVLSPDMALSDLLAGTGLVARMTGPGSITIESNAHDFVAASRSSSEPYFANVQAAVIRVLCTGGGVTRPGTSNTIVRLWVGPSGTVVRAQAVGSGSPASLGAYESALRGVAVGIPPPSVPQPILLAVLARHPEQPSGCDEFSR
jgi:hypothetical protein